MPKVRQRHFGDDAEGGSDADARPYFFRRNSVDILREAFDALLEQARAERDAPDRRALMEQRRTLFQHDTAMRRLFRDNFEAFSNALDHPELFDDQLRQFRPRRERKRRRGTDVVAAPTVWDDHQTPARDWERQEHVAHDHVHDHNHEPALEDDPLYDRAFQYACRLERWSRRLAAANPPPADHALEVVILNATLVPGKVAFGFSGGMDDDLAGLEVALIGYRQAAIFLLRILEALGSCYGRRIGRAQTVHGFLDEGRDLLADIEMKIAALESDIRFRSSGSEQSE